MYKVFVYGTLKRGCYNNHLMDNAKFIGEATLVEQFTMRNVGFPKLSRNDEHPTTIHGEVFEVNDEDMPMIDSLEGHPRWYKREELEVVMKEDGSRDVAWTYIMPKEMTSGVIVEDGIF